MTLDASPLAQVALPSSTGELHCDPKTLEGSALTSEEGVRGAHKLRWLLASAMRMMPEAAWKVSKLAAVFGVTSENNLFVHLVGSSGDAHAI